MAWNFNGVTLEIDLNDVVEQERYEAVFERMEQVEHALPTSGKPSELSRAYCYMLRDVFDGLFGEGTSDKLFGDTLNTLVMTNAFDSFLEYATEQFNASVERRVQILSKYAPSRGRSRKK